MVPPYYIKKKKKKKTHSIGQFMTVVLSHTEHLK